MMANASGEVRSERVGDVLRLTLSHPGRRNALTWEMYRQLGDGIMAAADDPTLAALAIAGTPEEGFAAGTDIGQFAEFDDAADGLAYERRIGAILEKLQSLTIPTFALASGAVVGGGLAIAASCDIIIAERGTRFGVPIARTLGNCLPSPVIARLMLRMGTALTLSMLLTARLMTAEELAANGFVQHLVERGELEAEAERMLARATRGAPLTLRAVKETVQRIETSLPIPNTDDLLELCYGSSDFAEGVRAFGEHRKPVWRGV